MLIDKEVFITKFNEFSTMFTYDNLKILACSMVIFLIFIILRKIFTKYIFSILMKIFDKTKTNVNKKILLNFEKPLNVFFILLGIYFSLKYIRIQRLGNLYTPSIFLQNFLSTGIILLSTWGFYNVTNSSSILFEKIKNKYDFNVDKVLFPFVSKILRFFILALAFIMIIEKWGYDVQGFIAGLGLGGLAFALAAKDAAANIFGGLIILMDKPFTIGDWITTDNVEGTVENITFRSTKIRTFEKGLVTVPNSILTNQPITNWSRRGKRRVNFTIGVTYDTSCSKISRCIDEIREMIQSHSSISKDNIIVNFDTFSGSSLDIFINFYTNTADWNQYLNIKQDINFKIMNILEKENVSIAFPSMSVYMENKDKK